MSTAQNMQPDVHCRTHLEEAMQNRRSERLIGTGTLAADNCASPPRTRYWRPAWAMLRLSFTHVSDVCCMPQPPQQSPASVYWQYAVRFLRILNSRSMYGCCRVIMHAYIPFSFMCRSRVPPGACVVA